MIYCTWKGVNNENIEVDSPVQKARKYYIYAGWWREALQINRSLPSWMRLIVTSRPLAPSDQHKFERFHDLVLSDCEFNVQNHKHIWLTHSFSKKLNRGSSVSRYRWAWSFYWGPLATMHPHRGSGCLRGWRDISEQGVFKKNLAFLLFSMNCYGRALTNKIFPAFSIHLEEVKWNEALVHGCFLCK